MRAAQGSRLVVILEVLALRRMYHILVGMVEKWFVRGVLREDARTLGCNGLVGFNRRRQCGKEAKLSWLYTELAHILEYYCNR
jgi:hypothetical protein